MGGAVYLLAGEAACDDLDVSAAGAAGAASGAGDADGEGLLAGLGEDVVRARTADVHGALRQCGVGQDAASEQGASVVQQVTGGGDGGVGAELDVGPPESVVGVVCGRGGRGVEGGRVAGAGALGAETAGDPGVPIFVAAGPVDEVQLGDTVQYRDAATGVAVPAGRGDVDAGVAVGVDEGAVDTSGAQQRVTIGVAGAGHGEFPVGGDGRSLRPVGHRGGVVGVGDLELHAHRTGAGLPAGRVVHRGGPGADRRGQPVAVEVDQRGSVGGEYADPPRVIGVVDLQLQRSGVDGRDLVGAIITATTGADGAVLPAEQHRATDGGGAEPDGSGAAEEESAPVHLPFRSPQTSSPFGRSGPSGSSGLPYSIPSTPSIPSPSLSRRMRCSSG